MHQHQESILSPLEPIADPSPADRDGSRTIGDPVLVSPSESPRAQRLSVIIPVLNEAGLIPDCIPSWKDLERQGAEVLLVDGGSDDHGRVPFLGVKPEARLP